MGWSGEMEWWSEVVRWNGGVECSGRVVGCWGGEVVRW